MTIEFATRTRPPDSTRPSSARPTTPRPERRQSERPLPLSESLRAPHTPSFVGPVIDTISAPKSGARENRDGIDSSRKRPSLPPPSELSDRFGHLVASSIPMREVFTRLNRLAPTEITVTLTGETGTGKDVLARTVHAESARADAPFVIFDCGAVAPNLVESELFGHERGSFTGAHQSHAGAFERAQGGTLFLDEVGELPLDLQPRLLRALENRSVRRVGGKQDRPIDVRIVAATNRDLKHRVQGGQFREDLYFRLAAAVVAVPPLRSRLEDLPVIVPQLLESLGRADVIVASEVFDSLRIQSWPGNVRQLKNVLACALAFVDAGVLHEEHLHMSPPDYDDSDIDRLPLGGQALERIERAAIKQTLALTGGMKVRAAEVLGIAVSTLYQKLKKYGL